MSHSCGTSSRMAGPRAPPPSAHRGQHRPLLVAGRPPGFQPLGPMPWNSCPGTFRGPSWSCLSGAAQGQSFLRSQEQVLRILGRGGRGRVVPAPGAAPAQPVSLSVLSGPLPGWDSAPSPGLALLTSLLSLGSLSCPLPALLGDFLLLLVVTSGTGTGLASAPAAMETNLASLACSQGGLKWEGGGWVMQEADAICCQVGQAGEWRPGHGFLRCPSILEPTLLGWVLLPGCWQP